MQQRQITTLNQLIKDVDEKDEKSIYKVSTYIEAEINKITDDTTLDADEIEDRIADLFHDGLLAAGEFSKTKIGLFLFSRLSDFFNPIAVYDRILASPDKLSLLNWFSKYGNLELFQKSLDIAQKKGEMSDLKQEDIQHDLETYTDNTVGINIFFISISQMAIITNHTAILDELQRRKINIFSTNQILGTPTISLIARPEVTFETTEYLLKHGADLKHAQPLTGLIYGSFQNYSAGNILSNTWEHFFPVSSINKMISLFEYGASISLLAEQSKIDEFLKQLNAQIKFLNKKPRKMKVMQGNKNILPIETKVEPHNLIYLQGLVIESRALGVSTMTEDEDVKESAFSKALPYYIDAALNGNIKACMKLGNRCIDKKDYMQAFAWYKNAALYYKEKYIEEKSMGNQEKINEYALKMQLPNLIGINNMIFLYHKIFLKADKEDRNYIIHSLRNYLPNAVENQNLNATSCRLLSDMINEIETLKIDYPLLSLKLACRSYNESGYEKKEEAWSSIEHTLLIHIKEEKETIDTEELYTKQDYYNLLINLTAKNILEQDKKSQKDYSRATHWAELAILLPGMIDYAISMLPAKQDEINNAKRFLFYLLYKKEGYENFNKLINDEQLNKIHHALFPIKEKKSDLTLQVSDDKKEASHLEGSLSSPSLPFFKPTSQPSTKIEEKKVEEFSRQYYSECIKNIDFKLAADEAKLPSAVKAVVKECSITNLTNLNKAIRRIPYTKSYDMSSFKEQISASITRLKEAFQKLLKSEDTTLKKRI